jgi:ribose transport system substrate-binding protein
MLPQEPITEADLDDYLERDADLLSPHGAKFGGDLTGLHWCDC